MGFLPIAVAIFGFVLLWAVVNYNSLVARRKQIQKLVEESNVLEKQRQDLLSDVGLLFAKLPVDDPDLFRKLQQLPTARSVKTKELTIKARIYVSEAAGSLHHSEAEPLLKKMENLDFTFYSLQQKLLQHIRAYNTLVSSMPSRIIAIIFGFNRYP